MAELERLWPSWAQDREAFGPEQAEIHEHGGLVTALASTSDGRTWASWGGGEVLLCETGESQPAGRLTAPVPVRDLHFAHDDRVLLAVTDEGALLTLDMSLESWMEMARRKAGRSPVDADEPLGGSPTHGPGRQDAS